jgi:hypothetical protein
MATNARTPVRMAVSWGRLGAFIAIIWGMDEDNRVNLENEMKGLSKSGNSYHKTGIAW